MMDSIYRIVLFSGDGIIGEWYTPYEDVRDETCRTIASMLGLTQDMWIDSVWNDYEPNPYEPRANQFELRWIRTEILNSRRELEGRFDYLLD